MILNDIAVIMHTKGMNILTFIPLFSFCIHAFLVRNISG